MRRTQDQMFSVVERWKSSGLSQKAFCESEELASSVFAYWHKKYKEQFQESASGFVEIDSHGTDKVEICYPSGVILRLPEVSVSTIKSLLGIF
jgi:guanylate kinase